MGAVPFEGHGSQTVSKVKVIELHIYCGSSVACEEEIDMLSKTHIVESAKENTGWLTRQEKEPCAKI